MNKVMQGHRLLGFYHLGYMTFKCSVGIHISQEKVRKHRKQHVGLFLFVYLFVSDQNWEWYCNSLFMFTSYVLGLSDLATSNWERGWDYVSKFFRKKKKLAKACINYYIHLIICTINTLISIRCTMYAQLLCGSHYISFSWYTVIFSWSQPLSTSFNPKLSILFMNSDS